jgi:hypothetical protein
MSNMHHCRFENTVRDLEVCKQSILEDEEGLSSYEEAAKIKLIKVCLEIVSEVYPELGDSEDNPLNYSDNLLDDPSHAIHGFDYGGLQ